MIQRPARSFISSLRAALAATSVAFCAMYWVMPGDVFSQASAPVKGQTYAVKPGQSLNDVAGDLTGSKDKDVRAAMARKLFDANPNAFGNHDINKLELGAVLNVPAADGAGGASASAAEAAPAQPQASVAAASESAPVAAAPASDAEAAASEVAPPGPAKVGPDPALYGATVALLIVLALVWKWLSGKRARARVAVANAEDSGARATRTFATMEEALADAAARNKELRQQKSRETQANEATTLDAKAIQRPDDSELNAVAASMVRYEAAQAFATPTEKDAPESTQTATSSEATTQPAQPPVAPFAPAAPASHYPDFVPPVHPAATNEAGTRESLTQEIAAREADEREAAAKEAEEHAAEQRATGGDHEEDEPSTADRFPMPKFPQEAIQALDSLEFGLPPRMDLTLNLPIGTITSRGAEPLAPPAASFAPIDPAPVVSQPVVDMQPPHQPLESVASQIETGTTGAGSVAGLGATQFAPLSLDFDSKLPRSYTEPLLPMTTAQLAAIARNKLEQAGEYIELDDLPGARTLLQEMIASNDPATRQRAATMLSTLAPHS
ncbi:putative transmembrane protein [Candidatus Burkholderia pumila]|uniref:Transmembrane protein n=1 Tax=Candidatus Burkholderia pumila TaxID=1090375 RepID=A0ABR5HN82_9BURK|nr:putative transmembrane protein [Candidatus Burkholderia pumila]